MISEIVALIATVVVELVDVSESLELLFESLDSHGAFSDADLEFNDLRIVRHTLLLHLLSEQVVLFGVLVVHDAECGVEL